MLTFVLLQLSFNFNKELKICVKYLKRPVKHNKNNENTHETSKTHKISKAK